MFQDFSSAHVPAVELVPMAQRKNAKNKTEDWTGKSDTALRRKLQNRLNQRASRQRRNVQVMKTTEPSSCKETLHSDEINDYGILIPNPTNSNSQTLVARPKRQPSLRPPPAILSLDEFRHNPLPTDQKLLTLMHFNFLRAMINCVGLLGFTPDQMYNEFPSPFVYNLPEEFQYANYSNRIFDSLPPTLQPSALQKTVPHILRIDCFPFPRFRDNLIRAGDGVDHLELRIDICHGVEIDPDVEGGFQSGNGSRTGLIVWDNPWLQSSWEIEENFARKWSSFFIGCDELIASSNYWRGKRGEPPLDLSIGENTSLVLTRYSEL